MGSICQAAHLIVPPPQTGFVLQFKGETASPDNYELGVEVQDIASTSDTFLSAVSIVHNPNLIAGSRLCLTQQCFVIRQAGSEITENIRQLVGRVEKEKKRGLTIGCPVRISQASQTFIFKNIMKGIFLGEMDCQLQHLKEINFGHWEIGEVTEMWNSSKQEIQQVWRLSQ